MKAITAEKRQKLRTEVSSRARLITVPQLQAATGDSRMTIWRKVKLGDLPAPFLWGNKLAWREQEIIDLINKAAKVPAAVKAVPRKGE